MLLKRWVVCFVVFTYLFSSSSFQKMTVSGQQGNPSDQAYFTENKGQWDPEILFVGNTSFGKVAFMKHAIIYKLIQSSASITDFYPNHGDVTVGSKENSNITYRSQDIKQTFINSSTSQVKGCDLLSHYSNYFIGNDPKKWASYCRNFAKITYQDVWYGIDLAYFFAPEGLKYEYYIRPEADPNTLQIKIDGAEITNQQSSLKLSTPLGTIIDSKLKVFEKSSGYPIPAQFATKEAVISFSGISDNRKDIVVIDPLIYSTLLGNSPEDDHAFGITADNAGNAYITGETYSSDFPITEGSYQTTYKGDGDAVIFKLNPDSTILLYSTFLGGSGNDYARSIAVDKTGNVFITGTTESNNFPMSTTAYQKKIKGLGNGFIVKLNSTSSMISYSTYLGGSDYDYSYGISLDSSGNAYVTGTTSSIDFPKTANTIQTINKGRNDAFVTKVNPSGSSLIYSALLGGTNFDYSRGIAVDESGNAYITGSTGSIDFPVTNGAYQVSLKGLGNSFIVKLNASGSSLLYSTYLGGSDYDYSYGISLDSSGNAYVTGTTSSIDFPKTANTIQTINKGRNDAFVTKVNPSGSMILFSSYFGGSGEDTASAISVDQTGTATICGSTNSIDFPVTTNAYQTKIKGGEDAFLLKINTNGYSLQFGTYIGSLWDDMANSIALDENGNAVICGESYGADYPVTIGAYWNSQSGEADIFVSKFSSNLKPGSSFDQAKIMIELWIGYRVAMVDNELVFLDTVPLLIDGTSVVPLRFIAESFNAIVYYDPSNHGIEVVFGSNTINLWINKPIAQIEPIHSSNTKSRIVMLDVAPFIRNNRTLVPVRFIAEAFGAKVDWNSMGQKISISTNQ